MMLANRPFPQVLAAVLLGIGLLGCNISLHSPTKPAVRIVSPAQGTRITKARQVQVQASAQDQDGVVRLELWVDGALTTTLQPPAPQTDYMVLMPWRADVPGDHTLFVRAVNRMGGIADSAAIPVTVVADIETTPTLAVRTESAEPPETVPEIATPTLIPSTPTTTPFSPTVQSEPTASPPTPSPQPTNTSSPQIAPGLYVTAIRVDPPEPRSKPAQFMFRVTFLNSTGAPDQLPRWRVLIFRPDQKKSMGDPRGAGGSAPAGTSEQSTQPWENPGDGLRTFLWKTHAGG